MAAPPRPTRTDGRHRCLSCLGEVGTASDGVKVPYVMWSNGKVFCADKERCERRWVAKNEPDPWADPDPNED